MIKSIRPEYQPTDREIQLIRKVEYLNGLEFVDATDYRIKLHFTNGHNLFEEANELRNNIIHRFSLKDKSKFMSKATTKLSRLISRLEKYASKIKVRKKQVNIQHSYIRHQPIEIKNFIMTR